MKRAQGITLVEITVASFLLSLVLLVTVNVLVPALNAWSDGQRRSEVSQGLMLAANWLGDDVTRSSPNSIKLTDEGVLVMQCALNQQADDSNEFNEMVAYWVEGKELFRGDRTLGEAGPTPPEVTIGELSGLESKRRIASGVEEFKVEIVQAWRIELHLRIERNGREGELQTSYSSIYAPFDPNVAEKDV
jgi:hypothetical protein